MRKLSKHIEGLIERFGLLLRKHKGEITKMIQESESESITIPVSLFISDAPGTQRVEAKMTLTKKEVYKEAVDIESDGQTALPVDDSKVKEESLSALQKANAKKESAKKKLSKKPKKEASEDGPK